MNDSVRPIPALIVFDLDGTLTESKQPLTRAMAHLLGELLTHTKVAIISGGALSQFLKQIIARFVGDITLKNLYLLPTSGAALYEYRNGGWDKIYEKHISETDASKIEVAIQEAVTASGVIDKNEETWGPCIEYRGGQISYSALGQRAPVAEKKEWDPTKEKRVVLQREITKRLPNGYTASMGGTTTIDIVKEGIDKAYGIHQLSRKMGIQESAMLYVGDELIANGNDSAVFQTEIQTKAVASPTETARFLGKLLHA